MTTTREETFKSRAISDTVRDARGYLYVDGAPHRNGPDGSVIPNSSCRPEAERAEREAAIKRDIAKARDLDSLVSDDEYTPALRSRVKLGAWIMPKHPAMPEYGPIRVQFKEDHPPLKPHKHWHGDLGDKPRATHVNGNRSGHNGTDTDEIHTHRKPAKYRMMPKPRKRYEHLHEGEGAPRNPQKHVDEPAPFGHDGDATEFWPDVFDPLERHEHLSHFPASGDFENRLDMHPFAAEMLPDAQRVFFSIEGVLKSDSLLSAGECAFAVPSVTLWDAPELEDFAQKLAGKTVYIVPDSDWASNMQVSSQAFECRERLRSLGVDAHVAAATPKCGDVCDHEGDGESHKRGVDDFLADGLTPDDLLILERERSFVFNTWAKEHRLHVRSDRAKNDIAAMWWFALHASRDDGTVKRSAEAMSNHVGVNPSVLHDIIVRFIEEGLIESSRPIEHTIRHSHSIFRTKRACDEHVASEHPDGRPDRGNRHAHKRTVERQVMQVPQKPSARYVGKSPRKFRGMATVVDWDRLGPDDEGPTFAIREDLRAAEALMTIRDRESVEADAV